MSDPTDIAVRTQRFRDAVRAFTPPPPKRYAKLMPMKEGIVELREKGASLRLIRELLATVDVSVSIDTIARFLAEVNGEITHSVGRNNPGEHADCPKYERRTKCGRSLVHRTAIAWTTNSHLSNRAPSERSRIRGPRIADPHNL